MQGYGLYTLEQLLYSPQGFLFTKGPGAYKLPGFGDIPAEFNVALLRGAPNKKAIFSSKVSLALKIINLHENLGRVILLHTFFNRLSENLHYSWLLACSLLSRMPLRLLGVRLAWWVHSDWIPLLLLKEFAWLAKISSRKRYTTHFE